MENGFKFDKEILDISELSKEFDHDKEMIKSLVNDFLNDLNSRMPLISEAVSKKDYHFISGEAHKMKGCAFSIFANRIGETLLNIELSSKKKDFNDLSKFYKDLMNDYKLLTYYYKMLDK